MDNNSLTPSMRLSDAVSSFCLSTFNDRRKYYTNYLEHAKWIWKDLFWNTIWAIKQKYVTVDKSTIPYRIAIPRDMVRFINVSVEDECGHLRALFIDESMNTVTLPAPAAAACPKCGQVDELGNLLSRQFTTTTRDVLIGGHNYPETTYSELCFNGDVQEIRETPVQNFTDFTHWDIKYIVTRKTISKLEVKPCGCVKPTEENKTKLVEECRCTITTKGKTIGIVSEPFQKFGRVKVTPEGIFLRGDVPDEVILATQTNGDGCEGEIMVPEFAVNTLHFGIRWRANALALNVPYQIEKRSKANYEDVKLDMMCFLDPIRVEEFINSQMVIPKWGAAGTGLQDWFNEMPLCATGCTTPTVIEKTVVVEKTTTVTEKEPDPIYFNNVSVVNIPWTAAMIAKYGKSPLSQVYFTNEDGSAQKVDVPIVTDQNFPNQTYIEWQMTGNATGFILLKRR